jgi:hypothetical protein
MSPATNERKPAALALAARPRYGAAAAVAAALRGAENEKSPDESARCHNCREVYSQTEPRVQRALRQLVGRSRAGGPLMPAALCWKCASLWRSVHTPADRWSINEPEGVM